MTNIPGWTDGLPYTLFRANQAVQRLLADAIDDLGVTITQLGIAVHLEQLGNLSGSDLARHFAITPQSASTALAHLEKLEWVTRIPHPIHKRVIWYNVTALGAERASEGRERLASLHVSLEERLSAELVTSLRENLTAVSTELVGPEMALGTLWPVAGTTPRGE